MPRNGYVRPGRPSPARDVTPDDVALTGDRLATFLDHPLSLGGDEVEQRIAARVHEPARLEEPLDLLARPAARGRELIAHSRVLLARAGILAGRQCAGVELAVHDHQAPSRTEDTDTCPPPPRTLVASRHSRDAPRDTRIDSGSGQHEVEDAVPRGPLGGRADAVAKSSSKCAARRFQWAATSRLTSSRGSGATGYIFSMSSICAPSGASRKHTRRPLVGVSSSSTRTPLARIRASVPV